jgi:hypothetical protein
MKKILVLLALGVALGYWLGFQDAQTNTDNIVVRLVHRTGGANRAHFEANNVDKKLDSLTR